MGFLPTTQRNTELLLIKIALLLEQLQNTISNGYILPENNDGVGGLPVPPPNSIFFNTTTSKLQYRDSSNVDHDLY